MQFRTLVAFILLSILPTLSFAGKAALQSGDEGSQEILLEYSGTNLVRMNVSDQQGIYMILRDGKAYSVFEQGQDTMVIDMASIGTMSGILDNMSSGQNLVGENDIYELISFEDTGSKEVVAGIRGDVYEITFVDGNGNTSTETLVLSSDERAREMTSALMSVSLSMAAALQQPQSEGYGKLQDAMSNKGMLRYGSNFRVSYFESDEPDQSRFVLPAAPQTFDLSGIMNNFQQAGGQADVQSETQNSTSGGILGNIFGGQAERQQNRIEEKSEQKVEEEIDSTVDKAVKKVFRGIFGN